MRVFCLNVTRAVIVLAAVLAFPVRTSAQDVLVTGTIYDGSGNSAIGGVSVKVVHEASGATLIEVTDTDGNYQFPKLRPGRYTITAERNGFVAGDRRLEWLAGHRYIVNLQIYTPEQHARRPKPHLSALPATVIAPKRTPDGAAGFAGVLEHPATNRRRLAQH